MSIHYAKFSDEAYREVVKLEQENARLQAEVERLEPELEQRCRELNLSIAQQAIQLRQIGELKAEVERLRKAGDAMVDMVDWEVPYERRKKLEADWNAAKEGKPSEQKSPSFIEDLGNGVEKHDLLFRYPDKEGKQS
jgi:predicted RNase H-like nuclease (RuvC/YqgF family)